MKRATIVLAAAVLALGLATEARAQTSGGEQELGFLATYTKATKGDGDGSLFANVRYGVFVTDAVQVGGGLAVGGPVDNLDQNLLVQLFGAYYFSPESLRTFYALGGYSGYLDDFGKGFAEAAFGFKTYLNESAAFFWEAGYGFAVSNEVDGGAIRSMAGVTFQF